MRYFFYGRVQGVGFRYTAYHKARELGLSGTVQNLPDGSVELILKDGNPLNAELIRFLQNQTGFIRVDRIESEDYPCRSRGFTIKA